MLSRVAESVYWMSRYLERATNIARMVEVNFQLSLDLPEADGKRWAPLVEVSGDRLLFYAAYKEATQDNVTRFLSFDANYPNSILSCLIKARENARTVRDILPRELWEEINGLYHLVLNATKRQPESLANPYDFFHNIKRAVMLAGGIAQDTMTRGEIWKFFRMGRMLERADKTSRLLDVKYYILLPSLDDVGSPYDDIQWTALLRSLGGFQVYRRVFGTLNPADLFRFLVLDPAFPGAILYCLREAEECLRSLSGTPPGTFVNRAEQCLGRLCADLSYADVDGIFRQGLHEYIDHLQLRMNEVDAALFETLFSPLPVGTAAGEATGGLG